MKKQIRCVTSAIVAAVLIIVTVNYAFNVGQKTKVDNRVMNPKSASDVVVKDFIHDNYEISEKNPWTDYGFEAFEYSKADEEDSFTGTISAGAAILVNANTKEVLYGKNEDQKMYPASTAKLMTALTVLQNLKPTDTITIGDEIGMIAADSSKAGFSRGQIVTVQELMEGLLISSGNDAAYVLAKAGGQAILENNIANEGRRFTSAQCVERFIYEMNKNARDLGLKNTNFESPDGYDDTEQYVSASDLSKIAIQAYNNKTISAICKTQSKYSKTLNKTWSSTNELLDQKSKYYYQYCMGMKTGTTDAAGMCLVSAAHKGNETYISVVMNEPSNAKRWNDSKSLLSFGLK